MSQRSGCSPDTLPLYLRRHADLGFTQDDVAALLRCIDSSQTRDDASSTAARLPAELLLHIVGFVPIEYLLDWRLVCRGFRDAIDGQILFRCLRRTRLWGYLGGRHADALQQLDDDAVHLVPARFARLEDRAGEEHTRGPVWSASHAVFRIDDEWYRAFGRVGGADARQGHAIEDADAQWFKTLDRLELRRPEEGFGTLRWCVGLDDAVLDVDFPAEISRLHFDVRVDLGARCVTVAWRDMLVRFLKTERALRVKMDQTRAHAAFTFSHAEDCLRDIRRARLAASLSPSSKLDRHIRWSLRLLPPLYARPANPHAQPLEAIEHDATHTLLLLRRAAALPPAHLTYLHALATDFRAMETQLRRLDAVYAEFKAYLSMSGFQMNILLPASVSNAARVPRNPVAWSDDLRQRIECQVDRWRAQKSVLERVAALLEASNEAMGVPEDSFDELGSEF